jgi:hypothetical protein
MRAIARRLVSVVSGSKGKSFPLHYIMKKLGEIQLPEERTALIEYLERLEEKLETRFFLQEVLEEFRLEKGALIMLDIIKGAVDGKSENL